MSCPPAHYRTFRTPVGPFALIESADGAITAAWLIGPHPDGTLPPGARPEPELLADLSDRLARYFRGDVVEFDDVPTPRGPAFHRRCWEACRSICRGETRTYGELATLVGKDPGAARAAGQAMRRNPLPVIVPCHRVVASGGRLYGYSGSQDPDGPQLAIKRCLLELEGALGRTVTR
ncbi:MAG: methylated-DNA--[protein]-cysteine S-methyltransferase [Planctomycetota bacterium]|jgi:methylated-DNA-[protein]-cysteine S-methyltransferase